MASWEDRIRPGAYTSPSGTRIVFKFEDVTREIDLRRTPFEFPGVDGVYVQRRGIGARRYPLKCIFTGGNCDLEATAFEAALLEDGTGTLEHPLHGTIPLVVPMGTVTRRDELVSGANQSIVEVAFWPTLRAVYPTLQTHPASEINARLASFNVAAAQAFADLADLKNAANRAAAAATTRKILDSILGTMQGVTNASAAATSPSALDSISGGLQSVSNTVAGINRTFRDLEFSINRGIDVLIGQPLLLGQQILNLIQGPGKAVTGIRSRLDMYGLLIERMFASDAGNPGDRFEPSALLDDRTRRVANDFHIADLTAQGALAGAVIACLNHTFTTRPEAIDAAATISDLFDDLIAWRDGAFDDLSGLSVAQVDTGAGYQELQAAVASTAGYLVEVSFSLVPERRIVLDRARTIIDLAAQLYGTVDSKLDDLINHNNLTGDEILELPKGRTIVYYPGA